MRIVRQVFLGIFCSSLIYCDAPSDKQAPAVEEPIPTYAELAASNAAVHFNMLGDSVLSIGNYPAAIAFYQMSMDSAAANADSFPYYDSKLDLACVHERLGELNTAIQMAEPVVEAFIRSGDSSRIGRGYATLSSFYGKANMPEKSIDAAKKGFVLLKSHGSLIERCAAYNQMAFTFSGEDRWADALPLLDTALLLMQASKVLDQLPSIYLNLGDCHRHLKNWPQARHFLQQSADLADSLGQIHVRSGAIKRLSQVAEATGDQASALSLFKQSVALRDTVLNKEKIEHLQTLEIYYQTKEKEYLISSLQLKQQSEAVRQNLLFALSALALVILGFWLFLIREKLSRSQLALKQNQQDLDAFVELLHDKNAQLTNLQNALHNKANSAFRMELDDEDQSNSDPAFENSESQYNTRILTQEDWEKFKHRFEKAYPNYLLRMRRAIPDLSGAEERLFLLIKVGFNTAEIASTLGISGNSVKKGRQRLRKRLNLRAEEDLDGFVLAF